MIRYALTILALLSPFFFPFSATLVLAFAASVFIPPVALVVGLLSDFLYYTPGASFWPMASMWGLLLSICGLLVRRFLKARIIGG